MLHTNFFFNADMMLSLVVESYILIIIFLLLSSMFGEFVEKRILAFFIYFELSHLLCILLLLNSGLASHGINLVEICTASLLIIGSSGAETGVALALFMRYFRLTGSTTFIALKKERQPWISTVLFPSVIKS